MALQKLATIAVFLVFAQVSRAAKTRFFLFRDAWEGEPFNLSLRSSKAVKNCLALFTKFNCMTLAFEVNM